MKTAEPTVDLIGYTEDALDILVYTKSGRLQPGSTLDDVKRMSEEEKLDHLGYMLDTIKSSFEFVHYTFDIKNVSRAFTHQLVRTREAHYQQQAMRVVDARDFSVLKTSDHVGYEMSIDIALSSYADMIDDGIPAQDARGILPTAIHTEIKAKIHLRELSHMAELRLCKRAEGEYQKVFKMMVEKILEVHPWAEPLLKVHCIKYGVCAFPRYTECPIQQYCFKPESIRDRIQYEWQNCTHQAAPKADEKGMTM